MTIAVKMNTESVNSKALMDCPNTVVLEMSRKSITAPVFLQIKWINTLARMAYVILAAFDDSSNIVRWLCFGTQTYGPGQRAAEGVGSSLVRSRTTSSGPLSWCWRRRGWAVAASSRSRLRTMSMAA